jgi:diguanylate cyclase (GGDEF)-like protein
VATRWLGAARWAIVALVAVQQTLLLAWPDARSWVLSIALITASAAGALHHGVAARRSTGHPRRVWSLGAVGMACWALAEGNDLVHAVAAGESVARTPLAHALNLIALAFAVTAMLAIPSAPRTATGRLRMLLDGVIVGSALFSVAWSTVLSPMRHAVGSTEAAAMQLAYPIGAIVLLAITLLLLAGQRITRTSGLGYIGGGMIVLTLALLVEIAADVFELGWLAGPVEGGILLAALLIGTAPAGVLPGAEAREWEPTGLGRALPYIPVILLLIVGAIEHGGGSASVEPAMLWGAVLAVGGVLARQFLALQLNARLTVHLEQQRAVFAHEAFHDRLTGLGNRAMLTDRLLHLRPDSAPALLLIDLDGFKAVNDTLGHGAGDELLSITAERIRAAAEGYGDALAVRLGGDEFAILLGAGGVGPAADLANTVIGAVGVRAELRARTVAVGASVGIAVLTAGDAERLLADADIALYAAKAQGKGRFRVFDVDMYAETMSRLQLQAELADALTGGQLQLAYQPIIDLVTGSVTGAEALIRWRHPERGVLTPDAFLPAAESMGLLVDFDRWVLREACAQLRRWRAGRPDFAVSVNVSAGYLTSGGLAADVARTLADHGLPGKALTIEITESALVADLDAAARTLGELRAFGVRVALDDFGVGYSSLAYLRNLPVDVIKIDRSFVRDLTGEDADSTIVDTIVTLARNLRLECVAEGVEDAVQVDRLQSLHCQRAQGYFFARPMPADRLGDLLTQLRQRGPLSASQVRAPR